MRRTQRANMDNEKKASFVRVMGKKRLRLRKGGVIQNFDSGGTILGGPGTMTQAPSGPIQNLSNALGTNAVAANIQGGTNQAQLNNAYTGATNALNNQINLTNTLNPQAATAVGNQNMLAEQEGAMARGEGPNPAANQLAQATGANVSNQAALMAGQRGASANPALIAREAAQQGAQTQQQAAGQAATLQAEQQIAAQNNLANLSNTQINQTGGATTALNTAQQNEQNVLQGANTAANNAAVSMQGNINNNNASMNHGLLGGITNAISNIPIIGSLFDEGGEVGKDGKPGVIHHGHKKLEFVHKMAKMGLEHFDKGGMPGEQIKQNPLVPGVTPIAPTQSFGGQYNPVNNSGAPEMSSPSSESFDLGIPNAKDKESQMDLANEGLSGAQKQFNSMTEGHLEPGAGDVANYISAYKGGDIAQGPHKSHVANFLHGGVAKKVPAMVSAGEVYLTPDQVKKVVHEGANPLKIGHKFKGKAKVKGDSIKNDTIPVDLEEGGVIVDRKNVMSKEKASSFVHHAVARKAVRK